MRFSKFWGAITKLPELQRFLDDFLLNLRKHNDIYKILTLEFTDNQKIEALKENNLDYFIKETMSKLLNIVLKVHYRLS